MAIWPHARNIFGPMPVSCPLQALDQHTLYGRVFMTIANKHAWQIWAILANEVDYDPCAGVNPVVQPKVTSA